MEIEIRHEGLHKYRLIKGTDPDVVKQKAEAQILIWNEMWERRQEVEENRKNREHNIRAKEANKEIAAERTSAAQQALSDIENTLHKTIDINDRIVWDSLLDNNPFPKPQPSNPKWQKDPREPKDDDKEFGPVIKWYYVIFTHLRQKAEELAHDKFVQAHAKWENQKKEVALTNMNLRTQLKDSQAVWEKEKEEYEWEQFRKYRSISEKKAAYFNHDPQAITEYCDMVLANSQYPDYFPQEWNLDYQSETKTVIVEYFMPAPENLPRLKEVKYVVSKDDFVEVNLPDGQFNKLYDSLLYQIALRTIHEMFESDQADSIGAVVFNGWIRSTDKGTGKPITVCVISIHVSRDEFMKVDLANIDPKTCFKTLKGVGSSSLVGLSPIAPILQINKEDKRFVSSYSVVGDIDRSTNLAAMDWEDFEHLIREIFEKEFSMNGGEVKITQASRDGGVDAIAFDPDPIRGGKIVIQAKRYTNTVGVSAVRDLYGTVVNEGATKGILVTTADYGPDAYSFAKGKPLTLLSGSNLLHLLEKHGHKAIIDLKAAKQILSEQKNQDN